MFFRHFTSALAATFLIVSASFSLAGCGQKGELFLPAKNGSETGVLERQNVKSHYIFGTSTSKTGAQAASSEPAANDPVTSAPEPSDNAFGGSAS
jgi:predicted small lipoprotein YifL